MTIEIVDFPIKNGDFPVRYVTVYQRVNKPCNMTYQGTVDRAPSLPSMPCQNHREADGDRPMNAGSSYSLGTKKKWIGSYSNNQNWDCFMLKKETWHCFVFKQSKIGLFRTKKTNLAFKIGTVSCSSPTNQTKSELFCALLIKNWDCVIVS